MQTGGEPHPGEAELPAAPAGEQAPAAAAGTALPSGFRQLFSLHKTAKAWEITLAQEI